MRFATGRPTAARALFTDSEHVDRALEVRHDLPELSHVILCDRGPAQSRDRRLETLADLLACGGDGVDMQRCRCVISRRSPIVTWR